MLYFVVVHFIHHHYHPSRLNSPRRLIFVDTDLGLALVRALMRLNFAKPASNCLAHVNFHGANYDQPVVGVHDTDASKK